MRDVTRCGNGGRGASAPREDDGEFAHTDLGDVVAHGDGLELIIFEADMDDAIKDGNRCGDCSASPHAILNLTCHSEVLGSGQTMTDDGGFQGDDRATRGKRFFNLWKEHETIRKVGAGHRDTVAERRDTLRRSGDNGSVTAPMQEEADVVLLDGRPVHLRPIVPSDAEALDAFHHGLSDRTIYFRYFAPKPQLSADDLRHLTTVDYDERFAFVALVRDRIVGVGRYDRIPGSDPPRAEVAFVVADEMQGRGLGSVLLEHLAAVAHVRGIQRFEAEVLRANHAMIATFQAAGYSVTTTSEQDSVIVAFEIASTARSLAVMREREQRAERRNMEHLLEPRAIYVLVDGRLGEIVLAHLLNGGFTGPVGTNVERAAPPRPGLAEGASITSFAASQDHPVDLVVTDAPLDVVTGFIADAAQVGVCGIVLLSDASDQPQGSDDLVTLIELCRGFGIRIVGPSALGLVNTQEALNASLVPSMPPRGPFGFFCQSGALGASILERMDARGLGISTFLSAGHRIDVSGNDALQFWQSDTHTQVILMYLESLGNPEKLLRLIRRSEKPIVMITPGGLGQFTPRGHLVPSTLLHPHEIDDLLQRSGAVITTSIAEMLDAAAILTRWEGNASCEVQVYTNSDALGIVARNSARQHGIALRSDFPVFSRTDSDIVAALRSHYAAADRGCALVLYVPPVDAPDLGPALAAVSAEYRGAVVHVHAQSGMRGLVQGVPFVNDVEQAVSALASIIHRTSAPAATQDEGGSEEGAWELEQPTARALLARVGIGLEHLDQPGPWDIDVFDDALFGAVLRIAPHGALAQAMHVSRVFLCPVSQTDITMAQLDRVWGLPVAGISVFLSAVSRLAIQAITLKRLSLHGAQLSPDGLGCAAHVSDVAMGPPRDSRRIRRMSVTYRSAVAG